MLPLNSLSSEPSVRDKVHQAGGNLHLPCQRANQRESSTALCPPARGKNSAVPASCPAFRGREKELDIRGEWPCTLYQSEGWAIWDRACRNKPNPAPCQTQTSQQIQQWHHPHSIFPLHMAMEFRFHLGLEVQKYHDRACLPGISLGSLLPGDCQLHFASLSGLERGLALGTSGLVRCLRVVHWGQVGRERPRCMSLLRDAVGGGSLQRGSERSGRGT